MKGLVPLFIMKGKQMEVWRLHPGGRYTKRRFHIVEKVRYMISDAAQIAGVESHVLRYWEDELELTVPRNELGHRYYTRENIQQFQKIKELKEQGYQLKAIRMILHGQEPEAALVGGSQPATMTAAAPTDRVQVGNNGYAPADRTQNGLAPTDRVQATDNALTAQGRIPAGQAALTPAGSQQTALSAEERMDQFRELMSDIVGHAIAQNNEELSQTIGQEVQERVLKEMDYLMREQEDAAEERFKKLDAAIRGSVHKKRSFFAKEKAAKAPKEKKKPAKLQTT